MQHYIKTILAYLYMCGVAIMTSCTYEDDALEQLQENKQWHTCELTLNVSRTSFSDDPQTRASEQWANGSKIYLTFTSGQFVSYGNACYNNGSWILSYNGKLAEGNSTLCTAVYFDNIDAENGTVVSLSPHTAIYEDNICSYNYENGKLTIGAYLKPKTARIRFIGSNNSKITISGISHYSSFDYASGKFISSNSAIKTVVSSDYTPYIYGEFADTQQPRLNLITPTSAFTRFPSNSVLKVGESGYMTIPTESAHNLWSNAAILKVNGVDFTMIPVTYTKGNFLLAETETTEQLYNAVIGENASNSQIPKTNISYNDWSIFISKISTLTGLDFRMPSREEWQYAFKGGDRTQGYTYSGSNTASDVAWYSENSNSKAHEVKQLQPNELGLYDMSGNLGEATSDFNGAYAYWCGGCYSSSESYCKVSSYDYAYTQTNSSTGGLRLALSND